MILWVFEVGVFRRKSWCSNLAVRGFEGILKSVIVWAKGKCWVELRGNPSEIFASTRNTSSFLFNR